MGKEAAFYLYCMPFYNLENYIGVTIAGVLNRNNLLL